MDKTLLITGGAGFVGSSIALYLKKTGMYNRIICLDNLKRRGSELNLSRLEDAGIEFFHGDVRNPSDLEFSNIVIDTIIECSAEPSVLAGYNESPRYVIETNLYGAINCLELARKFNSNFIFLSSSRVYPFTQLCSLGFDENDTRFVLKKSTDFKGLSESGISEHFPLEGIRSIYGATKLSAEYLIKEYTAAYGLKTIINRCGVITGPWQMGKVDQGVFVFWMAAHLLKKSLQYIGFGGTGKQVRDFLHIDDLCQLILVQCENIETQHSETYNVGGSVECSVSLLEATELCKAITGNSIAIKGVMENRPADIPWYITDNSKITAHTQWKPQKTKEDTFLDIYNWINQNSNTLKKIFTP